MTRLKLSIAALLLPACAILTPTASPLPLTATPLPPSSIPSTTPLTPTLTPIPTDTPVPTLTPVSAPDGAQYAWVEIASGLQRPLFVIQAGDDRLFVVEQPGRIRIVKDGQLLETPFLDISGIVNDTGTEQGLLGLAFHPDYARNGQFFVNYTGATGIGDTVVARYTASSDPNVADPDSAEILLTIPQPYRNHNGGDIVFGPDGLLYIGTGDGGDQGDPQNNGQNPDTLLGKMLRLDVDTPNADPEIWAVGLRNPWRFSFDRATGDLFIGDVGQDEWEEIDYAPAPLAGGLNFGWNLLEGAHPYASSTGDSTGLTMPIAEYSHSQGGCSVTGGHIYRGTSLPELQGVYFFGDYCSGIIWSLIRNDSGAWEQSEFMNTDFSISSFGEDVAGELYMVDHGGGVYRLTRK